MNKANLMKYAAAQRQADTGSIPIPQPKPQQPQIAPQVQQALSELETQAQLAARFVANADGVQQQDVVAIAPKAERFAQSAKCVDSTETEGDRRHNDVAPSKPNEIETEVRHDVAPVSNVLFDETEQLPSVPEKPSEQTISILPATETITDEIAVYIAQYFSPKSVKIEPERLLDNHHSLFCPADENEISELKDSIDRTGITEPLLVRSIGDGDYEIISGHRRRTAAEMLNWQLLPCRVADNVTLTDNIADEIMVLCNLHRRDTLRTSELARCVKILFSVHNEENKAENIALQCGLSLSGAYRYLKINQLTDNMLNALDKNKIPFGAAANIADLSEQTQAQIYKALVDSGFNKLTIGVSKIICENAADLSDELIRSIIENGEMPSIQRNVPAALAAMLDSMSEEQQAEFFASILQNFGGK